MEIAPYLNFSGNCAEAFKLYAKVLGGRITMQMTHGESPMKDHVSADWHDKLMHTTLVVGTQVIMGADVPPEHVFKVSGITVSVNVRDFAEAERIFKGLSEGGTPTMPFQKTFWSDGFGMVVDRFGIPWMVGVGESR